MKRERRIAMAKEVLQISATKVIVDYDFRNDSDEDITTAVAFPIPDYEMTEQEPSKQGFVTSESGSTTAQFNMRLRPERFLRHGLHRAPKSDAR